jgi:hypothetical protein
VIFIDDRVEKVAAAREIVISAYQFTTTSALIDALRPHGLRVPSTLEHGP